MPDASFRGSSRTWSELRHDAGGRAKVGLQRASPSTCRRGRITEVRRLEEATTFTAGFSPEKFMAQSPFSEVTIFFQKKLVSMGSFSLKRPSVEAVTHGPNSENGKIIMIAGQGKNFAVLVVLAATRARSQHCRHVQSHLALRQYLERYENAVAAGAVGELPPGRRLTPSWATVTLCCRGSDTHQRLRYLSRPTNVGHRTTPACKLTIYVWGTRKHWYRQCWTTPAFSNLLGSYTFTTDRCRWRLSPPALFFPVRERDSGGYPWDHDRLAACTLTGNDHRD